MVKIGRCTADGIMAMASRYDILQPGIRGRNYQCEWLRGGGMRTEFRMFSFFFVFTNIMYFFICF